jgi:hypothetical protein
MATRLLDIIFLFTRRSETSVIMENFYQDFYSKRHFLQCTWYTIELLLSAFRGLHQENSQSGTYCILVFLFTQYVYSTAWEANHEESDDKKVKGIVSRDLYKCFLYHSLLPLTQRVRLLIKFRFLMEFFDFCVHYGSWSGLLNFLLRLS